MRGIGPLILVFLFPAVAAAQGAPRGTPYRVVKDPAPDRVQEAVDELKTAFKGKDPMEQMRAIRRHAGVDADKVADAVAAGLRSRNDDVKLMAIEALGWSPNQEALKQLHRLYRRERKLLAKKEQQYAALFKAIGRHGEKSSLTVLADSPFTGLTPKVAEARIFGIANIRERDAVEALIKGMRLTGQNPRDRRMEQGSRGMQYFRPAMVVLTGEDMGTNDAAWQKWWRDNKKTFKISPTRPAVPADVQRYWEGFWDVSYAEGQ